MKKNLNAQCSNSKLKKIARKKEYLLDKKIKNEMRNKILESLEKHNTNCATKLSTLDSAKNLGKKRKIDRKQNENSHMNKKEKEESDAESIKENEHELKSQSSYSSSSDSEEPRKEKINPVKANSQGVNFVLSQESIDNIIKEIKEVRRKENLADEEDEFGEGTKLKLTVPVGQNVLVSRQEEIQNERIKLPILEHEHDIMHAINNNLVTVICGETGSGKSTQIPQFLYEMGYTKAFGKIAVTQPRRVAAISLASRVSNELGSSLGDIVGYQVRYDSYNISANTVIKYLTDGILLKELESDQLLLQYSVIIIDEAHERTINTDILIGLLSKIVKMRYLLSKIKPEVKQLRLVIMSATMRVDEFLESDIFKPSIKPSFVKVGSRQFPVTLYHSKRTNMDYMSEAFKLCCKIHRNLPDGGIIIFLTGKREIMELCTKLKEEFESNSIIDHEDIKHDKESNMNQEEINYDIEEEAYQDKTAYKPAVVLPLYSSLPNDQQMKVFQSYHGSRLIVIATNVAETSLTIPGVKYVIDSGRHKKRIFKYGLSFSSFEIEWISQASAEQRSGRAGRTCEGYCYRLYSNGLFTKMEKYTPPQILSVPLDQTILLLKSMNVEDVNKFPFITKPERGFVQRAIDHLMIQGAVTNEAGSGMGLNRLLTRNLSDDDTSITDLGRLMMKFPLPPKYAKLLIMSYKLNLIHYGVILVSVMNIESLFEENSNIKKILNNTKILNPSSDALTLLNMALALYTNNANSGLVHKLNLNTKKVKEMFDLSDQLIKLVRTVFNCNITIESFKQIQTPDSTQSDLLAQIMTTVFLENVARFKILQVEEDDSKGGKVIKKKQIYESNESNHECHIHPSSVIASNTPEFVIYKEIIKETKTFLMCNTIIKPEWLYNVGGCLIQYNLNTNVKEPYYSKEEDQIFCFVNMKYGFKNWEINNLRVEMTRDDKYYRYFARFLLEGEIIEELKQFKSKLNSNPKIITDQLSDIFYKVNKLVTSLKGDKIDTKTKLKNKLKDDKSFLRDSYLQWIDDKKIKSIVREKWPFIK